jgi:hypothetical protein
MRIMGKSNPRKAKISRKLDMVASGLVVLACVPLPVILSMCFYKGDTKTFEANFGERGQRKGGEAVGKGRWERGEEGGGRKG